MRICPRSPAGRPSVRCPACSPTASTALGLDSNTVGVHVSPRRIAAIATGLPAERAAQRQEVRGPKADAPEQARAGFARKHGLAAGDLVERDGLLWAISEGAATTVDALVPSW